jgi:hypothetical protein
MELKTLTQCRETHEASNYFLTQSSPNVRNAMCALAHGNVDGFEHTALDSFRGAKEEKASY